MTEREINEKFLKSLPPKWSVRVMLMKEYPELDVCSLNEVFGKIQAYDLHMRCEEEGNLSGQIPLDIVPINSSSEGIAFLTAPEIGKEKMPQETSTSSVCPNCHNCLQTSSSSSASQQGSNNNSTMPPHFNVFSFP